MAGCIEVSFKGIEPCYKGRMFSGMADDFRVVGLKHHSLFLGEMRRDVVIQKLYKLYDLYFFFALEDGLC